MNKLRVLLAHNYYQQPGGEDVVFRAEGNLLRGYGHEVIEYADSNDRISALGMLSSLERTIWSTETYRKLSGILREKQPDVAHFHNTFLMISPSAYYACSKFGIPVVQTLHNYRLMCPVASFFRAGTVCEKCLGRFFAWPGILHRCYRHSHMQSAGVAAMSSFHRAIHTWDQRVDMYIAVSQFSRQKFIEGGLPPKKIAVKPNFLFDPLPPRTRPGGDYVLYIGRLSEEKGLQILLRAWALLDSIPLKIAGDGPLSREVVDYAQRYPSIQYLGFQDRPGVQELISAARFVVVPSICYENFPMAIVEAFADRIPVIGSRLGASGEIIENGRTGLHFMAGDPVDLAEKIQWLWNHPQESERMGYNARAEYEQKYTAEINQKQLIAIYLQAIELKKQRGRLQRPESSSSC